CLYTEPFLSNFSFAAFVIALIPFSIVMIWGGPIFSFIFGEQWHTAGQYAQWIALWLLFSLSARPVIATIPVVSMQGWFLTLETIFTILIIAGFLISEIIYKIALLAIAVYLLISSAFYFFFFSLVAEYKLQKNA